MGINLSRGANNENPGIITRHFRYSAKLLAENVALSKSGFRRRVWRFNNRYSSSAIFIAKSAATPTTNREWRSEEGEPECRRNDATTRKREIGPRTTAARTSRAEENIFKKRAGRVRHVL